LITDRQVGVVRAVCLYPFYLILLLNITIKYYY
jgi:hypothetical protein